MNLAKARETFEYHTTRASESVRQLAFAAIAIVWVFKPSDVSHAIVLPRPLVAAGALAAGALAFDLLQSLYGAIAWGTQARKRELSGDGEFHVDRRINWPTTFCFSAKVTSIAASYCVLLTHLLSTVRLG